MFVQNFSLILFIIIIVNLKNNLKTFENKICFFKRKVILVSMLWPTWVFVSQPRWPYCFASLYSKYGWQCHWLATEQKQQKRKYNTKIRIAYEHHLVKWAQNLQKYA